MSELRFNVAAGEWVVVAPERSRRPEDFHVAHRELTASRQLHRADCPFCPGNEETATPGQSLSYRGANGNWQVRAFPNRYPALSPDLELGSRGMDIFTRKLGGYGYHEIVAESPLHNATLGLQSSADVLLVLRAWRRRFRALCRKPGIRHVIIFKNHGNSGGASLEHPHSQIVGLPVLPLQVRERLRACRVYHKRTGHCLYCRSLAEEREDGSRVVAAGKHFSAIVPYASISPYSIVIYPHRHACFYNVTNHELEELSEVLRDVLGRVYRVLKDPDYNLVLRSAHPRAPGSQAYHWYLGIVPRLTRLAGFELGTGMYINSSSPELDASYLRNG